MLNDYANICFYKSKILRFTSSAIFIALYLSVSSLAYADIPSLKFLFSIDAYYGDSFKSPAGIIVDSEHNEIHITDNGRNEVFIFSTSGSPLYRFGKNSLLRAPRNLVIKQNNIYISQDGKDFITVLDYRGKIVGQIRYDKSPFSPGRMSLDNEGNLYVINKNRTSCVVFDKENKFVRIFGEKLKSITSVAASEKLIYLISPYDNRIIQVYNKLGEYILSYEALEGNGGTLGLPLTAKIDNFGYLWILDALRGIIVYNDEHVEIARFNILGESHGQLFFPIDMAFGDDNKLYVVEKKKKRISVYKIIR